MLRIVTWLARMMAVIGGLVLTTLIVLTCVSVLGRGLNTFGHSDFLTSLNPDLASALIATGVAPILGDFELVEAGVAFAIFAFLPICQLYNGHASVDIFTSSLPGSTNRFLQTFWELVLSAVILLITWRLYEGMQDKMRYGETTFLLQFPIWWAYAASLAAAAVASIVAIYCAVARIVTLLTGRRILPYSEGAGH